MAVERISSNAL